MFWFGFALGSILTLALLLGWAMRVVNKQHRLNR